MEWKREGERGKGKKGGRERGRERGKEERKKEVNKGVREEAIKREGEGKKEEGRSNRTEVCLTLL